MTKRVSEGIQNRKNRVYPEPYTYPKRHKQRTVRDIAKNSHPNIKDRSLARYRRKDLALAMDITGNLIKGKSRGQSENKRVQYDSKQCKAEPREHLKILPDDEVAQIAKSIGINFPDK